jgi:hypothetical protein
LPKPINPISIINGFIRSTNYFIKVEQKARNRIVLNEITIKRQERTAS